MLVRGPFGGAQAIGSLGNIVMQRNPNGTLVRLRTTPVNPNSSKQATIRALMGQVSFAWTNTLTAAQRTAWEDYAATTPLPNKFGDNVNKGGRNMFLRTNVGWRSLGGALIADAPTTPGVADPVVVALSSSEATNLSISGVTPAVPTGALVQIQVGLPVSAARNYYRTPFTQATFLTDASTFPHSVIASVVEGQKYFVKARTWQADGKVSFPFETSVVTTA